MSTKLSGLVRAYERAVSNNAEALDKAEQLLKVLILVMPARLGIRSEHAAQAAISCVNLFGLYSRLAGLRAGLRRSAEGKAPPDAQLLGGVESRAVVPLACASAVEHVALVTEMYAARHSARWAAVALVELARALLQLRLLYLARGDLVATHSLTPSLSLVRSRSPVSYEESRWWERAMRGGAVPLTRTLAELLHILRPLVSLALMRRFGTRSWRVWLASLLLDVLSRLIHNTTATSRAGPLSATQRAELVRRDWLCLAYLLWSPCFEAVFGSAGAMWANAQLRRVPVVRAVAKFASQFIHLYRKYWFNLSFL
jgi:hypothetical protein